MLNKIIILFLYSKIIWGFELSIVHLNDSHSQVEPKKVTVNFENQNYTLLLGGYSRLKQEIDHLLKDEKNALLLHAGDMLQGSLYFSKFQGEVEADVFSLLPFDAMTIGNHEFDRGNLPLVTFLKKINFPIIVSNLDKDNNHHLRKIIQLKKYIIKDFGDEKIGVIGVTLESMDKISTPDTDTVFKSEINSIKKTIKKLQALKVNKIVILSHLGLTRDIEIAKIVPNIDVIIGGHSHSLIGDFSALHIGADITSLPNDESYSYPIIITNKNNQKVCIAQSGSNTMALGKMNISFDQNGNILNCTGANHLIASPTIYGKNNDQKLAFSTEESLALQNKIKTVSTIDFVDEDQQVAKLIDEKYRPVIDQLNAQVIAHTNKQLKHIRILESEIAPLVAESFYWKLKSLNYQVDVVIQNAGGIRTNIEEGDITLGFINGTLLPFGNKLTIFKLKGKDLIETLEFVINSSTNNGEPLISTGSFPYLYNLKLDYHAQLPKGNRIKNAMIKIKKQWLKINLNKIYNIATNDYMALGKDGYQGLLKRKNLKNFGDWVNTGLSDNEVFIEWLQSKKIINPPIEKSINYIK